MLWSKRERNKADKLKRIRDVAYIAFTKKGYDETTTTEVAIKADIGSATLFFYVDDKRDLLSLVFGAWYRDVLKEVESIDFGDAKLVDALIKLFRPLYVSHRRSPKLSRAALRELGFLQRGRHSDLFDENVAYVRKKIEAIIRTSIDRGELGADVDIELSASIIFAVYQSEIRRFMATDAESLDGSIDRLSGLLKLTVGGFSPIRGRRRGR